MKNLIPGMFSSITDAELTLAINSYDDDEAENTVSDTIENSLSTPGISAAIKPDTAANEASYHDSMNDGVDDSFK